VLRACLRDKHPLKSEKEISAHVELLTKPSSKTGLEEFVWKKIIGKMYESQDADFLNSRFMEIVQEKA